MPKNTIKTPPLKHVRNLIFMTMGAIIFTMGFLIFIYPNDLLSGGVWGIAIILYHYLPIIPIGIYMLILNIPLMLWAWKQLEVRFLIYTAYVLVMQSFLTGALTGLPVYTNDPLLACIFGGVLLGIGGGLVIKYHGSSGGLDIVSIILKEKINISVGTLSLIANVFIVFAASLIFGFEQAMYTMVSLYVSATVCTRILEGFNTKRTATIITEHSELLAQNLMISLHRGVTIMEGSGGYSGRKKYILMCVVSRFEIPRLKEIVMNLDNQAFISISEANEVVGAFFKNPILHLPDLGGLKEKTTDDVNQTNKDQEK